jgi:hypothetical protein
VKSLIKRTLVPSGLKLRRLHGGIAQNQMMAIDLQSQMQRYLGLDERELAGIVSQLISSCRTLVDVGANDGYYTMAFLASSADRVITCEPGPASIELLANAAANGHQISKRFLLERRLIGNNANEAKLSEILADYPRPIFVKVDVDGGELGVLESAQNYPALNQISWVVETHSVELEQACIDWFSNHRFQTEIVDAAWWRRFIPEQRPLVQNRWLVAQPSP